MSGDVVIAYIHPGQVSGRFCESLVNTLFHDARTDRRIAGQIAMQSSPRIAEARSQVVDRFAEHFPGVGWLLMIDADMSWEPDAVDRLLHAADRKLRPIVGGLCFAQDGKGVKPTLYRLTNDTLDMEPIRDYPRGELVQVDATGAAFMLIHRSVFAGMKEAYGKRGDGSVNPYPWFVEGSTTKSGWALGEDIAFCLRAKTLGIPIHVDCGTRIGHEKTVILTEEMFTP